MTKQDKKVFDKIKKHNGERVAHVIRDAGLLYLPDIESLLEFAGNNPEQIKTLLPTIEEKYNIKSKLIYSDKNPFQLLDTAGYDSFYVTSFEQQNSIAKYFRDDEKLCTFQDSTRFRDNYMIHAIKRGANKIKPADDPKREDEYGTSVISIQINKRTGYLSIKNRYNHTVSCPDATFYNNPDNIIPGLTLSLANYFGVILNVAGMPDHFTMLNGKIMKYQHEIRGRLYGVNWWTDRYGVHTIKTDYEIMFDCMVLDLRNGKIRSNVFYHNDSRVFNILQSLFKNGKIQVQTNKKNKKQRLLSVNGQHIATLEDCHIVELTLPGIKKIESDFGYSLFRLREINLPDTETIGASFFAKIDSSYTLETVNIPKAKHIEGSFLFGCTCVTTLNAPMVESIGVQALQYNNVLTHLYMPNLMRCGDGSESCLNRILDSNNVLTYAYVPKLKQTMPYEYDRLQAIVERNTQTTHS